MNSPVNIGSLPLIDTCFGAVLRTPSNHLGTATDPELFFGRCLVQADGSETPANGMVVILLAGHLKIGGCLLEGRHRIAAIGAGRAVDWQASEGCEVALISDARLSHATGVAVIDADCALTSSAPPAEAVLLTARPGCASAQHYKSPSVTYGIWSATPYARRHVPSAVSEFMFLLNGSVALSTRGGDTAQFDEGELLPVPQAAEVDWVSTRNVRKFYYSARYE